MNTLINDFRKLTLIPIFNDLFNDYFIFIAIYQFLGNFY